MAAQLMRMRDEFDDKRDTPFKCIFDEVQRGQVIAKMT